MKTKTDKTATGKSALDIVKTARDRMAEAVEADRENRARDMDDLEKLIGRQWPDKIRQQREADGKPCLTINRLPQFVRQVTGDIRRMNPAIRVSPTDNKASEEVAEIYEGLIRHIEQRSEASTVYEQTTEQAAASSIGWFRLVNEWEREDSFDQEIRIERIRNAFSVYCDPAAQKTTREDARFLFITETMRKEDFDAAYPGKTAADVEKDPETDGLEHWHNEGKVVVAEYFWREPVERELVLLADGSTIFRDEAARDIDEIHIVRTRKVQTDKIMWAKISGVDVLEGPQEVPCKYIPVFAVTGEEWHVGEEVYRSSVIRFAKDPQQLYNFMRSASAEVVTMQPKAPYVGTLMQFQGLERFWQNANSANYSFLPYNPDPKAPGPPQRQQPPVASQGLATEAMQAAEDMKATTGVYDAALGNQSNETSGVAIRQRQMESDVSTSIYSDNMAAAIAACGRALVSMIPRVYDTQRVIKILGEDGQAKDVEVNGQVYEQGQPMPVNDLTIGSYDVRVSVGPNYSTRRQETAEGMMEFIRVVPGAAQIISDLIAKAMDWPDAERIAERLAKTLPPGVRDADDMSPEEQQAMQQAQQQAMQEQAVQAQMMQAAQQIEMRKAMAETTEAEADAEKARFEAAQKQIELMMQSGQMQAAIQQAVQQQVVQVLMASSAGAATPPMMG